MIKGVTHVHLGSIWYQSEPLEGPYCPNQVLGLEFFAVSYSKPALVQKAMVCISRMFLTCDLTSITSKPFNIYCVG